MSVKNKLQFRKLRLFYIISAILIFLIFLVTTVYLDKRNDISTEVFTKRDFIEFEKYIRNVGALKGYEILKSYYVNNEPDAHDFAHIIGQVAFEKQDIGGFKVCDSLYNYGCYHGFMQVYLTKYGISAVKNMENSCTALGNIHAPSCLHGIGHGLMMEANYDLSRSLTNCEILLQNSKTYCVDGVFMERIVGSMLTENQKIKTTEENILEPCRSIDKKYQRECWRNQVSVWFAYFGNDSTKVGAYCASLNNEYWEICFETIGLINVQNFGGNYDLLYGQCQIVNQDAASYCLIGEMKELLFEGKSTDVAYNLCNYTSIAQKQKCFEIFSNMFNDYKVRFGQQSS